MQAKIEKRGELNIIHLSGHIDYESADVFKHTCLNYLRNQKIVFNLEGLNFVGSVGITPFLEAIVSLNQMNQSLIKFCKVSSEFKRVFASSELKDVEVFENLELASVSFNYPSGTFLERKAATLMDSMLNLEEDVDLE